MQVIGSMPPWYATRPAAGMMTGLEYVHLQPIIKTIIRCNKSIYFLSQLFIQ